jgi:hypothetical protein
MKKDEQYIRLIEEIKKHGKLPAGLKRYVDDNVKMIKNQPTHQPYGYEYNGQFYFNDDDVDRAIADKLSEQGYNNADVPSEHIMEEWDNVTELFERVE